MNDQLILIMWQHGKQSCGISHGKAFEKGSTH